MNKKSLTEQEIRSQYIRPAIIQAGWQNQQIREEYYFTAGRMTIQGNKAFRGVGSFADYLLIYQNVPLAIVEAKDNYYTVGAGMQQALKYAETLDVPFVYSSNGDAFLEHDRLATAGTIEKELPLNAFPSPAELWHRYKLLRHITPEQETIITQDYFREPGGKAPRYYQEVAINRAVTAVAQGQKRLLLVMATGTGKTFTAFQIIWRLWKAKKVGRVLFLADRNFLVDQTKTNDFKHFGDKMTKIQKREIDKAFEVYLALYQGVSGTEEEKNVYKQFSPDFFDLVIVDECHRGSAAADSAWREVLEYFNSAVQIGLTATPKETKDISNIDYFGEPVYTYSLKRGVDDGFLAPFKVVRVNLDKDLEGWMPEAGQTDKYGNVVEQREYTVRDFDRTLVLEKRTELVAQRVADYLKATDPYGKTIVFCVDIDHAERMRQALVNAIGPEAAQNRRYVMRITGDNDEGKMELDPFMSVEEKFPVIATTSKLLTTGADVQLCKVIVLDTIINSMTEFKQIIGRGTRLRPDKGKTHFTIMDFRHATKLFSDPEFDGEPEQEGEFDPDNIIDPKPDPEPVDHPSGTVRYVIHDVPVTIVAERVQYYDASGQLVTKSFMEFSRENVQKAYQSLDDFLQMWGTAGKKQAVLVELIQNGVLLDELQAQVGKGYDPFDLICHIAFDRPILTRQERAKKVRQADYFAQYGEVARKVLEGLLDKYANEGIEAIESAAESKEMQQALQVLPFRQWGSPTEIVKVFGGRNEYVTAVRQLSQQIYQVQ